MDICEVCEKLETDCVCVYCRACGYKELKEEMYQGKCRVCEEKQMIGGIR